MVYEVEFADRANKKYISFKNWRGLQYTHIYNADGKAVVRLDLSPTSQQIDVGWEIKIYRDGVIDYLGRITRVNEKQNKRNLFCVDLLGELKKQNLYQYPDTEREASAEINNHLDGFDLKLETLKAETLLEITGTTKAWHWEDQNYVDYCKSIGEQCVDLKGDPRLYVMWIDPAGNVIFKSFGSADYYQNLPLQNISMEKSIDKSYNRIKVYGFDTRYIPNDKDYWSEGTAIDEWTSSTATISRELTLIKSGLESIKAYDAVGSSMTLNRAIRNYEQEGNWNSQALKKVSFWFYWTTASTKVPTLLGFGKGSGGGVGGWYSASIPAEGVWEFIEIDCSGTIDWGSETDKTNNEYGTLSVGFDGTDAITCYFDSVFLTFDPLSQTISDDESVEQYGLRELIVDAKELITESECLELATTLLAHYKDPKYKFTASLDGYYKLLPNATVKFEYKGNIYEKVIRSVTHFVTVDGKESTNLTMEDYKKDNIDSLREKILDIAKNKRLVINTSQAT
jgi:hypothetical protein